MTDLQKLHLEAAQRLDRLDFDRLWPGFHRFPFALYQGDEMCLGGEVLPRDGSLRGNTAARYAGELTAVWDAGSGLAGPDLLTADLVHEMFHAFQMEQGEARFPDDFAALEYPLDVVNFSRKLAEDRLLCRALRAKARGERRALLGDFRALREARRETLGPVLDQELLPETVEGMAEYMGLRALSCLSEEKYRRRLETALRLLEEPGPLLLDVRRVSYYTGAVLLLAAEAAGIPFAHQLTDTRPVYDIICPQLPCGEVPPVPADETIGALIASRTVERRETLSRFFRTASQPVSGDFQVLGYDPMNMFQTGRLLYGSHFWLLCDRKSGQTIELGEAALLRSGGRRVQRYWRAQ